MLLSIETSRKDLISSLETPGFFQFKYDAYKRLEASYRGGVPADTPTYFMRTDHVYVTSPLKFVEAVTGNHILRAFLSQYLKGLRVGAFILCGSTTHTLGWSMLMKDPDRSSTGPDVGYFKETMNGAFVESKDRSWSSHS